MRHSYSARVKAVSALLVGVPAFAAQVQTGVLAVLAKNASPDLHGMHIQASQSKAVGGTCRDAVRSASHICIL